MLISDFFKKNFIVSIYGVVFFIWYILMKYSLYTYNKDFYEFLILVFKYLELGIGVFIFLIWLGDKRFKFIYYLGYVILVRLISVTFSKIATLPFFEGKIETILVFLFLGIILIQCAFNFFKDMSYKKN